MVNLASLLDNLEKAAKIAAVVVGGAWVYFNTVRGRTFIPRLQPRVSGKLLRQGGAQYLLANIEVQNIGSSIALIKTRGTALRVKALRAFHAREIVLLDAQTETAARIFDMEKEPDPIQLEPQTVMHFEQIVEVPGDQYDAFRIELRVSAVHGGWFHKADRKWRAWAVVIDDNAAKQQQKEVKS